MRNNPISMRILVGLTLALAGLMNWTTIFAQPSDNSEATNSLLKTSSSYNATHPGAVTLSAPASKSSEADTSTRARAAENYARLPLSFEANWGQAAPGVKFFSRGNHYALFLTSTESVLVLDGPAPKNSSSQENAPAARRQRVALRMKLAGANPEAQVEGLDERAGKSSYFIGKDASRWHSNVPSYARVQYRSVYPGVDLIYYGNQRRIEYDFVVGAGADCRNIRLAIEGAKKIRVDASGDLVLTTAVGEVRQHKPFVYQEENGEKRAIEARYVFDKKNQVGFEVGLHDHSKPLVIDPVLDYATYLGGSSDDDGRSIVLDGSGNAYITGRTRSFNFPIVKGSFNTTYTNAFDVFVTKLNAAGSDLIYSTYLGGNSEDQGFGIAVDSTGNAYVSGSTSSSDYPTTPGAFQTTFSGGFSPGDGFVTRLNATGTALVYSTFLGGLNSDQCSAIAVDSSGNAYVTGFTSSTNFPTTPGAFQTTLTNFSNDAFITKLNANGTAPIYSTFLGGANADQGAGIAVDSSGRAFISGSTISTDFDVTAGAFQTTFGGSSNFFNSTGDAFVTEMNATGMALVYSTYVGGSSDEGATGIALNSSGEAFISGVTSSFNFPVTPGVVRVMNGGAAKSSDAAANWAAVNTGLNDTTVISFAINPVIPSTVYAGTNMGGVFKSTNAGANWTAINSGLTNLTIRSLAINPTSPSILYLGTGGRGVFKSSDGGSTWRGINTGQGGMTVNALVIDPANPAIIYAGTDRGVFKSVNSGATWTGVNTGLNSNFINAMTIDPANTSNLYASTFSGVFISRNGGMNWAISGLSNGIIRALQVDPAATAKVYAGGNGGVFKSTDAGLTWRGVNAGLTNRNVNTLVINPTNSSIVYAGTENGVFKSTDGGGAWSSASKGIAGSVVNTLAINALVVPSTLYAGTTFGVADAFVARLNSSGSSLVYSTYMGGINTDNGNAIAIDSADNAYVTGRTNSPNFPTTPGTLQNLANQFDTDAFVTKLNPSGSSLVYSTYLGGNDSDEGFAITTNSSGNAYIAGFTESSNFPVTPAAYQTILNGGNNIFFASDAFVAKLNQTPSLTADLRISMTGPTGTLSPGTFISYNITVTNDGPDPAFSVVVTDELSPSTTFGSCNSNSVFCSNTGNTVTFSLNSLAPGATFTANVSAFVKCSVADGSTITNTATVESLTPDPNANNNTATFSNNAINTPPTISPTSQSFPINGGSGSVGVMTNNNNCSWTAVSNVSWITITFSSGCCNGFVDYNVAANGGPPRIGTLTIAGNTFTVMQAGNAVTTTIGVYLPSDRTFYLRNSNSGGFADITAQYGPAGALPVVGDWDGNGTTTIGVYDPGAQTFYLRNSNTPGNADITIQFGPAGAIPIAGDWDGNGTVTIGVYDPATQTFYLRNSNTPGNANITIQFGPAGAVPIAGDWNGDGATTIGAYDSANQTFYLRNSNSAGNADITIGYGPSGAKPVVGDWDSNGTVTIGVYAPSSQTFFLRNSNSLGLADLTIQYGPAGATPLAGNWDGQ